MKCNEVEFLEIISNDGDMISIDLQEQRELYNFLKKKFETDITISPVIYNGFVDGLGKYV